MSGILLPEQFEYLQSIHSVNRDDFCDLREYAIQNKIPVVDELTMKFIEQLIAIKNPVKVLEIGTAIGYSALRIRKAIRKEASLSTIEKSSMNAEIANENFIKYNVAENINVIKGEAKSVIPSFRTKFDFIFLDADKKDYIELLPMICNVLEINGLLIIDNLLWKGRVADSAQRQKENSTEILREFNKLFLSESKLISTVLPVGDGIGIGIKK